MKIIDVFFTGVPLPPEGGTIASRTSAYLSTIVPPSGVRGTVDGAKNIALIFIRNLKKGRGAKSKLEKFKDIIADLMEEHSRSINTVLALLSEKHGIKVCRETLRNFLK